MKKILSILILVLTLVSCTNDGIFTTILKAEQYDPTRIISAIGVDVDILYYHTSEGIKSYNADNNTIKTYKNRDSISVNSVLYLYKTKDEITVVKDKEAKTYDITTEKFISTTTDSKVKYSNIFNRIEKDGTNYTIHNNGTPKTITLDTGYNFNSYVDGAVVSSNDTTEYRSYLVNGTNSIDEEVKAYDQEYYYTNSGNKIKIFDNSGKEIGKDVAVPNLGSTFIAFKVGSKHYLTSDSNTFIYRIYLDLDNVYKAEEIKLTDHAINFFDIINVNGKLIALTEHQGLYTLNLTDNNNTLTKI